MIKPRLREVIGIAFSRGGRILILNFDDVRLSLFLLSSKLKLNFSNTIANQKANQCLPGAGEERELIARENSGYLGGDGNMVIRYAYLPRLIKLCTSRKLKF